MNETRYNSSNHRNDKANWARYDGSVQTLERNEMIEKKKGAQTYFVPKEVDL